MTDPRYGDPRTQPHAEERIPTQPSGWRWKTVDIILLLVLLIVFWPAGLAFLVWKIWNDRQPVPVDVEDLFRTAGRRIDETVRRWGGEFSARSGPAGPTGNAAFDAHVAKREEEIAAQRRALDEEIGEFRRFMAEAHGDAGLYERFKARRESPRDPQPRA
jgi:hypothetical protein